jgi:hypothetical protein
VVEPNAVGGWDVHPEAQSTRHSRHSSRDEAVEAARALGGDVVVRGLRGEVLARHQAPAEDPGPEAAPAGRPVPAGPSRGGSPRPGMRIGQLLALSDQTDETGRLLLEDSAPEPAVRKAKRAGIAMETAPAPYQDTPSRLGGPMNVSAYEALRHDVGAILDGFAWLAGQHRAKEPSAAGAPRRLFVTSYLGVSLAHVLFHRAEGPVPPHGALPAFVASIFKASRGVFSFSVQLENDLGPDKEMTAAEVMTYAEDRRQLVRPETGRVCAAPTRLIERTIEAVLTGAGADPARSTLPDLVDFEMLWEFYRLQDKVGEVLSTYRVVLNQVASPELMSDPNRLLRTVVPAGPAQGRKFGDFTQSVLAHVNDAQAGLNRALGRAGNARPITLADLMGML